MMTTRSLTALSAALLLTACALSGCVADKTPGQSVGSPTPKPSTSSTPSAEPVVFAMPTHCSQLLPTSRLDAFTADGIVLLGGPDGLYGDNYLADQTPEQHAGGITCIWGPPDTEVSTVTVSIAPVSASSRSSIVSSLTDQGLNEDIEADAAYYWLQGDTDSHPAIVNVVSNDSWISVIETIGGLDLYDEAEAIAAEAHDLAYH